MTKKYSAFIYTFLLHLNASKSVAKKYSAFIYTFFLHLATLFGKVCDAPYLVGCIVELAYNFDSLLMQTFYIIIKVHITIQ